jgi:hypothetical protein
MRLLIVAGMLVLAVSASLTPAKRPVGADGRLLWTKLSLLLPVLWQARHFVFGSAAALQARSIL